MPHGCRLACHSARAGGGIDSAKQRYARRPSATGPARSRAGCGASPTWAQCGATAVRAELRSRRSRDRPVHRPAVAAVARVARTVGGSYLPAPGLPASRSDSPRLSASRAARLARHRSDGACSRAWPDRWDSARSGHRRTPRGWNYCPRLPATNLSGRRVRASPASRSGSDPTRRARCQSRSRRQHVIPDPHPSSCGSSCQGMPLRRTKTMPVRHARSDTRGRPPCGLLGRIGKNGSTRSHRAAGGRAVGVLAFNGCEATS